jgi:hypothetical protein
MSTLEAHELARQRLARQQVFAGADGGAAGELSIVGELMKIVGAEAAARLVRDFGGTRLYVPNAPMAHDVVTRSIGLVAAIKLARLYGGDRLVIPSPTAQLRRPAQIAEMRARHMSVAAIARELRCTERYVYKVLAGMRADPRSATEAGRLPPERRAGHAYT